MSTQESVNGKLLVQWAYYSAQLVTGNFNNLKLAFISWLHSSIFVPKRKKTKF